MQLDRLARVNAGTEAEATRLMALTMAPYQGDEGAVREFRGKMREWLVQNRIMNDPEVRDAAGRVMRRRRVGAPAGARQEP